MARTGSAKPSEHAPELKTNRDGPLLLAMISFFVLLVGFLIAIAVAHVTYGLHRLPGWGG